MGKIITWSTKTYSDSPVPDHTDSLFFAEDVIRYRQFVSPVSIKLAVREPLLYNFEKENVSVAPGSFLLVNDGLEMECLPCNGGVKGMVVYFTNELLHDVHRGKTVSEIKLLDDPHTAASPVYFFQNIYQNPNPLTPKLYALAQQMDASGTSARKLPPDVFYELAEAMFLLQSDISQKTGRLNACMSATRDELFRRVWFAKNFMRDSWRLELELADIARRACLSPYHFHRSFRAAFGQPPMKYFRQLKLENAKNLLATKKMSVTEVALECGFSDIFSFSKAFKRAFSVSPSEIEQTLSSNIF